MVHNSWSGQFIEYLLFKRYSHPNDLVDFNSRFPIHFLESSCKERAILGALVCTLPLYLKLYWNCGNGGQWLHPTSFSAFTGNIWNSPGP